MSNPHSCKRKGKTQKSLYVPGSCKRDWVWASVSVCDPTHTREVTCLSTLRNSRGTRSGQPASSGGCLLMLAAAARWVRAPRNHTIGAYRPEQAPRWKRSGKSEQPEKKTLTAEPERKDYAKYRNIKARPIRRNKTCNKPDCAVKTG